MSGSYKHDLCDRASEATAITRLVAGEGAFRTVWSDYKDRHREEGVQQKHFQQCEYYLLLAPGGGRGSFVHQQYVNKQREVEGLLRNEQVLRTVFAWLQVSSE